MQFFTQHFHLINIPPLLIITLFFIIGIIAHTYIALFCVLFFISLGGAFFAYKQHIPLPKQLLLCSFFMLAGAYLHQKELRDYDDFYAFTASGAMTINGVVIDKNTAEAHYKKSTVITLAINTITNKNSSCTSNKVLMVYMGMHTNDAITVGDTITLSNIHCKRPSNESFSRYQIKEQIASTVFEDSPHYTIENHPTWSLRKWIWNQKQRLLNGLTTKLSPNGFRFFSSLFLGNRACIKESLEETNEQFKIWGISHFLARSGLHLALFIFIWQAIFCVIPLPLIYKQLIISLLSCIYFILTWTSAPFTRSFALFILNKFCLFTKTPFHLLHYLTVVALCFLVYCPLYLFFLDFQLSFALTFALAWFNQLSTQQQRK
jgi:predicted membrane metal-binding protein